MKKITQILLITSTLSLITSCANMQITTDEHTTPILAKISSRNVGCAVAKTQDAEIDRALRNIYTLVETGKIPNDAIIQLNNLAQKYTENHPTLVADLLDLISLFGVQFNAVGEAQTDQVQIPEPIMKAVADGYTQGYELCLLP